MVYGSEYRKLYLKIYQDVWISVIYCFSSLITKEGTVENEV